MGATYQPPQWLIPDNANTDKVGNYCFELDGTADYIDLGTTPLVTGVFSASMWIRRSATVGGDTSQVFLGKDGQTSDRVFNMFLTQTTGVLSFWVSDTGAYIAGKRTDTSTVITDTDWHHLVFINHGDSVNSQIFIDGIEASYSLQNTGISTLYNTTAIKTAIGADADTGTTYCFLGNMSEVCIFNYALTSGEVTTLYGDATDGVGNPMGLDVVPVAYYKGDRSAFGGAEWAVPNQVSQNYAFEFDGPNANEQYVDTSFTPDGYTGCTYSAWINPSSVNARSGLYATHGSSVNDFNAFFHTSGSGYLYIYIGGAYGLSTNISTIIPSEWFHLAIVYDGTFTDGDAATQNAGRLKLYINGSYVVFDAVFVGTIPSSIPTGNTGVYLGTYTPTSYEYGGKMSNVAVWNSALTAGNITTLYNNGTPETAISFSPISWWKLDDSATFSTNWSIPDAGSASNTGTSANMTQTNLVPDTVTRGTSLYSNYSFDFDGVDDSINCGNPTELQFTGNFTLSAWVKTTSSGASNTIIGKDSGGALRSYLFYMGTTGLLNFVLWRSGVAKAVVSTGTINDGNWHSVIIINDGTNLKLYIDGVLDGSVSDGGSVDNTVTDFWIGARDYYLIEIPFDGLIDEVSAWNSDQTSNVATIYNSGQPSDLTSLSPIAWWRMGEDAFASVASPTAWTIPDQIGSNDGTSSGNPELVGEAPQSYANGLSDSMDIYDRIGESGFSDLNALSYNMPEDTRKAY